MYVYVDVVLSINMVMNTVILFLTAWVMGISYRYVRILLAAGIGSVYALGGLLPELAFFYAAPFKVVFSLMIVVAAFGFKSTRTLLLLTGMFYVVSFIFGGAVVGWLYFWQLNGGFSIGRWIPQLSWHHLAVGSCLGAFMLIIMVRRMILNNLRRQILYPVKIEYDGQSVQITAMLDTGNRLYTFSGRKPVILVDCSVISGVLSKAVTEFLQSTKPDIWVENLDKCGDYRWLGRIHVIPYHAVGNRSMLVGFQPDKVTVITGEETIETEAAVIGIYDGKLSGDDAYSALLHPAVLHGQNKKREAPVCVLPGRF